MTSLPPVLTALLAPGEKVLWSGQPRPSVFILRGLPNLAYGVTWGVLGAFWYRGAMMADWQGWWRITPWLSLPFIFAGFSFWIAPMRLGKRARQTWYVVTNQRLFIAEVPAQGEPRLRVFAPEELAIPEVRKRIDHFFDVILTKRAQKNPHLTPPLTEGFFGIPDGPAVAEAIRPLVA